MVLLQVIQLVTATYRLRAGLKVKWWMQSCTTQSSCSWQGEVWMMSSAGTELFPASKDATGMQLFVASPLPSSTCFILDPIVRHMWHLLEGSACCLGCWFCCCSQPAELWCSLTQLLPLKGMWSRPSGLGCQQWIPASSIYFVNPCVILWITQRPGLVSTGERNPHLAEGRCQD